MDSLKIFTNEEFGSIRTIQDNNKIWFCGNDIASALGYVDTNKAIRTHCKGVAEMDTPTKGGVQRVRYITEGDIYRLIIKSKLPSAEKFEKWIFDKVLPSIRKTGGYVNDDELFINNYLPYADDNTKQLFRMNLQVIREQNKKIAEMQPKSDYFDALVDRKLLTNIRDTAKELNIKQNKFVNWLIDKHYLYRDKRNNLRPYSEYNELFSLKEYKSSNSEHCGIQTLITPKGKETFRLLLEMERKNG